MPPLFPILACSESISVAYPSWEILLFQTAILLVVSAPMFEIFARRAQKKRGLIAVGTIAGIGCGSTLAWFVSDLVMIKSTGCFTGLVAYQSEPWGFGYIIVCGIGAVFTTAIGLYAHRVKKLRTRTSICLSVSVLALFALLAFVLRPAATGISAVEMIKKVTF